MGFFDEKKYFHVKVTVTTNYTDGNNDYEDRYVIEGQGYASFVSICVYDRGFYISPYSSNMQVLQENGIKVKQGMYTKNLTTDLESPPVESESTLTSFTSINFTNCNKAHVYGNDGDLYFSDVLPNIEEKFNEIGLFYFCVVGYSGGSNIGHGLLDNPNFINKKDRFGYKYEIEFIDDIANGDTPCPYYYEYHASQFFGGQEIKYNKLQTTYTIDLGGCMNTPKESIVEIIDRRSHYALMYLLSDLEKYKGITVDYKNEDNNTTPYYPNSSFISKYKDVPTLILQSKSGITIGGITGFTDLVYKKSLNSANELNFNFYKYLDGEINPLWEEMKDLKTVYIPEFEEKFQIEISYTDDEMETKVITGTALCEAELSQIIIRGLEINTADDMKYSSTSTYQITKFYDPVDTNHSLLHRVLKTKANHYTIGHVDDTLCNLAFEFTADETDIYSFLTDEVAKKCECLFLFDSMTRTINAYDLCSTCQDCYEDVIGSISRHYRGDFVDICPNCGSTNVVNGYGKDTTILIDKENLANSITKESDVGSLKNCLYVEGGDENINAAFILSNPNGSQYIYYFSPETLEDMGEPLSTAITEYTEKCELYKTSHAIDASTTRHVYFESEDKMINNDTSDNGGTDNIYVDNYNTTVQLISNLSTDASFQNFEENKKDGYIFTGQSELVKELYNAMDLETFIQTNMMPEYSINKYDKYTALSLLTQENFGTLAIAYLNKTITNTSVSNTIEAKAKTLIDTSKYKVSIFNGSFTYDEESNIVTWTGTFQITDRLDDDDTTNTITNSNYLSIATDVEKLSNDKILEISSLGIPSTVTVYINDNFVEYTKNSVEATIAKEDLPTTTNICSCTISLTEFMNEIDLYSIGNLKIFYNVIQSCCEVLSSKLSDLTESSVGYSEIKKMYDDYFIKLKLITGHIELREEDLLSVKQYRLLMSAYINEVAEELNFQTFLENYSDTQNLWEIFNYYRREDTYKNDNIISDNLETNEELLEYAGWLMTYAKKELLKMGTPQYAISTDLNNLLALPEFKPIIEDFEVGNWIHIRTDVRDDIEEDIIYKLRLLSYQINFDEIQSIDVEFSNVVRTIDCMSDMKSILDSAQSMATSYNSVYKEVDKSKETNEIVSTWVNDSLDLTNQLIKTEGNDQSITIDEHGILARKCDTLTREYDSHQLKIFSNGLYFTPDNWETIKAGVGKFVYKDPNEGFAEKIGYGVIADTIVSNIVCTNELGIYNEEGSVKIDGEGISITNGEITIGDTTSDTYAKITKDGILYASGGEFSGKIKATSGTIGGWCIEQEYIINKNENIYKYFKLDIDSGIDILDTNNSKRTVISTDGWIRQVGSDGLVEITNGGIGFYNNTLEWEIEVKEAVVGGTGEGSVEIVAVEDFDLSKQYMSIFPSVYSTVDNMKGMIFQTNTESDFVSFTKNYGDGQIHKVVMDFSDNATAMFNVYGTSTFNSSITLSEDFGGEIGKKVSTLTVTCYEDGNYFLYCHSPFASPYLTVNNAFNLGNFEDGSGNKYINTFYTLINAAKDCVRMGVIQDGWIGQGIKWDVYGNLTIDGYATTSDERLKNSFESLEKFDDVFMKLNPTTFKYNNDTSSKIHFGFKAQNIEDVLNSHGFNADDFFILSKTKKHELSEDYNGYDVELGLSYQEFTAWNTHMIQKCIEENNKLKNKIQELYNKINDLQGIV